MTALCGEGNITKTSQSTWQAQQDATTTAADPAHGLAAGIRDRDREGGLGGRRRPRGECGGRGTRGKGGGTGEVGGARGEDLGMEE